MIGEKDVVEVENKSSIADAGSAGILVDGESVEKILRISVAVKTAGGLVVLTIECCFSKIKWIKFDCY
jgi:hypothetical protein